MGRWLKPEQLEELRKLVKEGVPSKRIRARLGINQSQFYNQVRKMGLKTKKEKWGLESLYRTLQGPRRKP